LPVLTFRHNPSFHAPLPGFSLYPLASIPLIIWLYILFTGLYILFIVYALHRGWNYVMPAPYRLNLGEPPAPPDAASIAEAMALKVWRLNSRLWATYASDQAIPLDAVRNELRAVQTTLDLPPLPTDLPISGVESQELGRTLVA